VILGACGSDEGPPRAATTTTRPKGPTELDYITATAVALSKGGGFGDTETNKCAAEAYVSAIGVDTLRDTVTPAEIAAKPNVLPKDLGLEPDAAKLYRGLNDCVDVDRMVLTNYSTDQSVLDCLTARTPEELRFSLFASSLAEAPPEPADDTAVKAALAKCPPVSGPARAPAPAGG